MASARESGRGAVAKSAGELELLDHRRTALLEGEVAVARRVQDKSGRYWVVDVALREVAGRMEPVSVEVRGATENQPLTRELLKSLPFGELFRNARRSSGDWAGDTASSLDDPEFAERARELYGSRRGKRLGDEELQAVAAAYLRAYAAGEPVVQAVAESAFISTSAAAKRIRAARDAGLLPEPTRKDQG